jgi:hypothetical protein
MIIAAWVDIPLELELLLGFVEEEEAHEEAVDEERDGEADDEAAGDKEELLLVVWLDEAPVGEAVGLDDGVSVAAAAF